MPSFAAASKHVRYDTSTNVENFVGKIIKAARFLCGFLLFYFTFFAVHTVTCLDSTHTRTKSPSRRLIASATCRTGGTRSPRCSSPRIVTSRPCTRLPHTPSIQDRRGPATPSSTLKTMRKAAQERGALWSATVALNIEPKSVLPEHGVEWLYMRVTARQMAHGRTDVDVVVRNLQGELVALSQQVAVVVSLAKGTGKL